MSKNDNYRNHHVDNLVTNVIEVVRNVPNNNHHNQQQQQSIMMMKSSLNKNETSSLNNGLFANSNNNNYNYNYNSTSTSVTMAQSSSNNNNNNNDNHHRQQQQPQQQTKTSSSTLCGNTNIVNNNNATSNNNKKHNIGFRLRRLFFGSNLPNGPTTTTTISSKSKTLKDSSNDVNENKSYIRHNPSLHSNSSESSNEHRAMDSRRKRNTMTPKKIDNWPFHSNNNNNNNNTSHSMKQQNSYECPICLLEQPLFQFPELITCQHRACFNCLRQYLRIEIYESRINITCLQCQELMHPNDIKTLLHNDHNAIEKYESFMVRRTLITDPDVRWCPAPDCDYCVIATGCASCPMLKCERPGCETLFCYHCKQEWHPSQTCDQARAQRGFISSKSVFISSPNPNKSNVTFTSRANDLFSQAHASTSMDSFVPREDIKPCPCCKVFIIKMNDGSCNHMTCSVCGTEFCWLCMQKISDLHYLSPSGCTFWGKKPWSRKKKIMWQLGMLVGAPVGIALIAGIAVPAIIIGIPVWVGRKLYSRFERNHMSRHKSNLFVTTGVLASIFVSPILAAVAVGIGVPLLLAYVYGVVPISLCRSGGCGVSTSSSGVRIELDEDEIPAPDGVSVDTALSGRAVTNPSIGDVSLGMSASLSIGSNSHLDRVVLDIQPDRESSSIAACAGSITSNYINNNNGNNNQHGNIHGAQMKLETLSDINSNNKRFSLSSQNADSSSVTLSFGDRSVNTNPSLIDDASLKAHAGSLLEASTNVLSVSTNNNGTQLSLSPVEVHVINDSLENDKKQSNLTTKTSSVAVPAETAIQNVQAPVNLILNKFESRSMEYLSNNYCNICHKSHKPCCPNFQHPNKTIKLTDVNTNKKLPQQKPITFVVGQPRIDGEDKENLAKQSKTIEIDEEKFEKSDSGKNTVVNFVDKNSNNQVNIEIQSDNNNVSSSSSYSHHYHYGPTLTKKAMSQIFYPTNFNNNNNNNNDGYNNYHHHRHHHHHHNDKISKSNLSHSLSFTSYNSPPL